jgi:hypothetical protein
VPQDEPSFPDHQQQDRPRTADLALDAWLRKGLADRFDATLREALSPEIRAALCAGRGR